MRILAEEVHNLGFDTEQFRYVLIAVQAVCDKKWNDDHIWRIGELVPLRDQWRFFHVGFRDGGDFAARANAFLFPKRASDIGKNFAPLNFACVYPSWRARIRIQRRSMSDNQKRALVGSHRTKRSTACPERNSNASNAEWKAAAAAAIDTATEE